MKKTPLYIASALLTVLLMTGAAQAKTDTVAATAPVAAKTGGMMTQGKMDKPMMPMHGAKLSEAGQKLMKEAMDKLHAEHQTMRDQMKTKHEEMAAIVKAPTFDKDAYMAKNEEINLLQHQMMKSKAESFSAMFTQMNPEDRAAMSEMRHMGMGMGKMGRMGDKDECPMMKGDMMKK